VNGKPGTTHYTIRHAKTLPDIKGSWDSPAWEQAETLEISHFRPESSDHHPHTCARLLYDKRGVFGIFRVKDRYVRSIMARYGDPVYKDSCVEFFVQPKPDKGYFNFEFNCGGIKLCSYITDPERTENGFKDFIRLSESEGRLVSVFHTMPQIVEPEIIDPIVWILEFFIPFKLLEKYTGPVENINKQTWNANFYKCGDETSHPHWASWSPVKELNFHLPECFGTMEFD
jgi:hypothetical protein